MLFLSLLLLRSFCLKKTWSPLIRIHYALRSLLLRNYITITLFDFIYPIPWQPATIRRGEMQPQKEKQVMPTDRTYGTTFVLPLPGLLSVWMRFLLHAGLCPRVARIRFLIFLRRLDRADHGVVVAGCILVPFGIVSEVIKLIYHTATETRFSWREVASRLFGTHQNTHTNRMWPCLSRRWLSWMKEEGRRRTGSV